MTAERNRLANAQKRNFEEAQRSGGGGSGGAGDDGAEMEGAWEGVFARGVDMETAKEEAARRRKLQRKATRRAEKRASESANAGAWSVYISGVPPDLSYTSVHSLFSKVGEVRRVKLYKDGSGAQKGDGIVTFGSEAATSTYYVYEHRY